MADYSNDYKVSYANGSCAIEFKCFDTPNSVRIQGVSEPDYDAEDVLLRAFRRCIRLHGLWSFSSAESDISRINAARAGERVEVDADTAALLSAMKDFTSLEPGFDFTIGPASFLWKKASSLPTDDQIGEALKLVGAEKVALEGDCVVKSIDGVQVDVGGAAKGYAADAVSRILRDAGVESADVDLGGNLFMVGRHPKGRPWRVSIRVPEGVAAKPRVLQVVDSSVVTSGTYERFVQIGGERYHHIVDKRTGWPAKSAIVSATVVGESSLEADMVATSALLCSEAELDAFAARHPACKITVMTQADCRTL